MAQVWKRLVEAINASIQRRLSLAFSLMIAGLVAALCALFAAQYSADVRTMYRDMTGNAAQTQWAVVQRRLDGLTTQAEWFVKDRYVRELLDGELSDGQQVERMNHQLFPAMAAFSYQYPEIVAVHLFYRSDRLFDTNFQVINLSRVAEEPWVQDALPEMLPVTAHWSFPEPQRLFTPQHQAELSQSQALVLRIPVHDLAYRSIVGVFEIQLDMEQLAEQLELSGDGLGAYEITLLDADAKIPEARYRAGLTFLKADGVRGFCALYQFPTGEIERQARAIIWGFVLLGLVCVVLVYAMVTLLVGRMLKKLRLLTESVRKLPQQPLGLDPAQFAPDEIGQLASALNRMSRRLDEQLSLNAQMLIAEREAQVRALQAQMDPHYLYNLLDGMRMLCQTRGQVDVADAISSAGELMRYRVRGDAGSTVSLCQELAMIREYVDMHNLLYGQAVEYTLLRASDVPLDRARILRLMLLPVVENAFVHGFSGRRHGYLVLELKREGDALAAVIRNDGQLIAPERLRQIQAWLSRGQGEGIGLVNTHRRLQLTYGERFGVALRVEPEEGETVVEIRFPLMEEGEG